MKKSRKVKRRLLISLAALALLLVLVWFLQTVVAHQTPPFVPDYPRADLTMLLEQPLTEADYDTLFLQTGLAKPAVDALLQYGEWGIARVIETQEAFFASAEVECTSLFGPIVKEDHLKDENGDQAWAPPLADLQKGDILLSFSTHSFGWRHGHGGLVTDAENQLSLEAVVIGSDSALMPIGHWRAYSNYMVLRLKDITPEQQGQVAEYALEHLNGVPYHLTSGFLGPKAPPVDAPFFGLQCSYLVWYAFQQFGFDLDSDGGRLVSVDDLAHSPLLEVVQIYGLDPRDWR